LTEQVSTKADSIPTEQALHQAISQIPGADQLSAAQVQSLTETWRKTRAAHGKPVAEQAAPSSADPNAPTAPGQPTGLGSQGPSPQYQDRNAEIRARAENLRAHNPSLTPEAALAQAHQIVARETQQPQGGAPGVPPPTQHADPVAFAKQAMAAMAQRGMSQQEAAANVARSLTAPPYNLDPATAQRVIATGVAPSPQHPAPTAPAGTQPQGRTPRIKTPAPLAPPGTTAQGGHPAFDPRVAKALQAAASAATYGAALQAVARSANVDPALLEAVVGNESGGRNSAVSKVGAQGLGQLMPGTAAGLGVDPNDPVQNLAGAAVYLRAQLERFKSIPRALAAYNAGPGAVEASRSMIPNIPETQAYVRNVMARYLARRRQLQGQAGQ
jgi:soluble lytic murein transglycosylase-like protein